MLPLLIPIKLSKWHEGAVFFGVIVVCICVFSVFPPWWQVMVFIGAMVCSAYRWLKRYVWLRHPLSIVQIKVTISGWRIILADGSERSVRLVNGCRFLPNFIVLRMRCENNKLWWCLLLSDSAPEDAMRRLRVIGNWRPNVRVQAEL